jgi:hypothetical protein
VDRYTLVNRDNGRRIGFGRKTQAQIADWCARKGFRTCSVGNAVWYVTREGSTTSYFMGGTIVKRG